MHFVPVLHFQFTNSQELASAILDSSGYAGEGASHAIPVSCFCCFHRPVLQTTQQCHEVHQSRVARLSTGKLESGTDAVVDLSIWNADVVI